MVIIFEYRKSNILDPLTSLDNPLRLQEAGGRGMKVVRLSALRSGRLYPRAIPFVLIYLRGRVYRRVIVRLEGLKIPINPSGIEPVACRHVAQCLNKLLHRPHLGLLNGPCSFRAFHQTFLRISVLSLRATWSIHTILTELMILIIFTDEKILRNSSL
jgi:hypothetical protein